MAILDDGRFDAQVRQPFLLGIDGRRYTPLWRVTVGNFDYVQIYIFRIRSQSATAIRYCAFDLFRTQSFTIGNFHDLFVALITKQLVKVSDQILEPRDSGLITPRTSGLALGQVRLKACYGPPYQTGTTLFAQGPFLPCPTSNSTF